MSKLVRDVEEFHKAVGQVVGDLASPRIQDGELRAKLLEEEVAEFRQAVDEGDLVGAADAIADVLYVAVGAAVTFGLDLSPIWDEVQRSNMAKVGGGVVARSPVGKILKPAGWVPPDVEGCINRQVARHGRRQVIALLGQAGSGKSTIAQHLVDHFGAKKVSFAGPLKKMAKDLFGLSDAQLYGDSKEVTDARYGKASRVIMQSLGSLAREHLGKEVWVRAALQQVADGNPGIYVIDDCRYPNEAAAVAGGGENWDGHVWKVVRPGQRTAHGAHESETGVDAVDPSHVEMHLQNDGTLVDLFDEVDGWLGAKR